mmetsp:Transcript_88232/g.189360  ORF Transcript_88232/g.189360 Transcript_88232/m.189360 type:complete len:334 (+) Transcript_88232:1342-2343(+)
MFPISVGPETVDEMRQCPAEDGLHDELEVILCLEVLENSDDVRVVKTPQQLHLPVDFLRRHLVSLLRHALEDAPLLRGSQRHEVHLPVCTPAQLRSHVIKVADGALVLPDEHGPADRPPYGQVAVTNRAQQARVCTEKVLTSQGPEGQAAGALRGIRAEAPTLENLGHHLGVLGCQAPCDLKVLEEFGERALGELLAPPCAGKLRKELHPRRLRHALVIQDCDDVLGDFVSLLRGHVRNWRHGNRLELGTKLGVGCFHLALRGPVLHHHSLDVIEEELERVRREMPRHVHDHICEKLLQVMLLQEFHDFLIARLPSSAHEETRLHLQARVVGI